MTTSALLALTFDILSKAIPEGNKYTTMYMSDLGNTSLQLSMLPHPKYIT